ncbi:DMT family transporter [Hyphomonas johnsonii]|uniref:Drug/metabolite transporter permease n=1 Tax=Hyphomonas johnsonii MHS-2 TaxID=1280950 RepID=A0A059FJ44_9PROT|nr:DMT family transporter [Hyphomonas johnsonii]KCZ90690.1 drug/metabolite transporter permease [Hyphomonas johnsonii MHS-2]
MRFDKPVRLLSKRRMEIWIPITIAAAFLQNLRSALQKRLKATLSTWGATAARFVYAAPLALLVLGGLVLTTGATVPPLNLTFVLSGMAGGLAQILATGLLIHLFSYKNFTVATAFTKTEPIQTALFGIILLGDHLSLPVAVAILVSLVGVILISIPADATGRRSFLDRKALLGILSGGLFGLSAVAYRGASLSLADGDVFLRASVTLAFVTGFQAITVLVWLLVREPGQTQRLLRSWRSAGWVGLVGMLGSLAWFTAFTLQNAALVRALGQVEVIFMIAASILVFKERVTVREIAGVLLVAGGIIGLVLCSA